MLNFVWFMKVKVVLKIFSLALFIGAVIIELKALLGLNYPPDVKVYHALVIQLAAISFLLMLHIQELIKKVSKARKRWEKLANNLTCCVILVDKNDKVSFWNKKAEEILEWKAEEVLGKDISFLFSTKSSAPIAEICTVHLRGLKKCETDILLKNGRLKRVELTDIPLSGARDKERLLIVRDPLEVSALEGKLMQSEKLACIGHLAAGVAHEISNPLSSIQSLVQLVQRKSKEQETQKNLKKVREHIDRIARIVRELVDFSRPTTGEMTRVQINDIISSAVGLLRYDSRCEKLKFELALNENLPEVKGVPDQIHQVVMNLILNSIDACQKMGSTIEIKTYRNGKFVVMEVIDDGEGIKPEIIDRIFEPFFTTKDVGHGTGLGLSVSHGIVASMGGHIKVESTPRVKTKFTVCIPVDNQEVK